MTDKPRLSMRDNRTIGGTDIAAIVGIHPYKSAVQVWLEKTGRAEPPDLSDNQKVRWGSKLEPLVAQEYEEQTGRKLFKPDPEQIFHPEIEWYSGSPDLILNDMSGLVEIKTTDKTQRHRFAERVPDYAFVQGVWYARLVSVRFNVEIGFVDFPILIGGNEYVCHHQDRDKEVLDMEEQLMVAGEKFWTQHVLADTPPEIKIERDGSDRVKNDLHALWRRNEREHKYIEDYEIISIAHKLAALKADEDMLKSEIDFCENSLKNEIRDAAGLLLPDGSRIDWKTQGGSISWKKVAEELGAPAELVEKYRGADKRVFKTHFKEIEE